MCCHQATPGGETRTSLKKSELLLILVAAVVIMYVIFDIASNPEHPENHVRKAQYDG